ncbi:MAG: hypothetical protein AAGD92_08545 [Pseudomonadota bacterium]
MIEDPEPTSEEDEVRQGETRGMNKLLTLSLIGGGVTLLIALLFFAS